MPISATRPARIGFLLIDGFALMSFAAAIEPLRAANNLSGRLLYQWFHVSVDGKAINASSGLSIKPDCAIATEQLFDIVLVCAGGNPTKFSDRATMTWLRGLARRGVTIGGISGGPYILARAKVLDGYRCTIHWEHVPAFVEAFPHLQLTRNLFEIDRDRMTCGGGVAGLDMMHALIRRDHGQQLASRISDWFLQANIRLGDTSQRVATRDRAGGHPKLLTAIELMERRLREPASRAEIARAAGLSLRQLERLFASHFKTSIERHYLTIRLQRARILLRQTALPVTQIGAECGFQSPSHFSRAYRQHFTRTPSADRLL
ncbi:MULTISPECIES: GlxA family transcriptional regulator [Rhodopseudomonas]|uniref:Transcriptional regulator n=1 Tax=Rhodopseudomonas palustris TaxID=1076 RepID=A0A0D7F7E4_RHOPL|nr:MULTISPECIES: GlxA family transcriptional regulator [Rhodopseudomonas]KIZ47647.1 transcriptional regulator [Rhodopseudomonas palustris]MDF3808843.1 GlxA family transcriptional regulator [Rhodopseudomonas sp. BAL398]WOK19857.1 GlxA family transcriptional regulator [Rhodopseudomonas sp. BAL398]